MNSKVRMSPQQQQENISRKQLGEFLETHGFVTGDISPDLGEDILVRIYDEGVSTGLSFYVQLKSTDDIEKYHLKSGDISYPFEVKDLEHWAAQVVTVVLIIWDVPRKQGWWLWINDAIRFLQSNNPSWKQKETTNIHISSKNQLNEAGLSAIRLLLANLYYPIVSKEKELIINALFTFPQTEEGRVKFEELKRNYTKGDEVELDGKYIKSLEFPEWWKRLYGDLNLAGSHLKISPNKQKSSRPVQIEFYLENESVIIPYIELRIVKQGEEEITLSNEEQRIAEKFLIILNKITLQTEIRINANFSNLDGYGALRVIKMQKILAAGGSINLTYLDSNLAINIPHIPFNKFSPPEPDIVEFIEQICLIQKTMGIKITFPESGLFTNKDIQAANKVISIIEKGICQYSGKEFVINLLKQGVIKFLQMRIEDEPVYLQIINNDSYLEILSVKLELGRMIQKIRGNWKMPLEEVYIWIKKSNDEDSLDIHLVEVEINEEFEKWVKK